MIHFPGPFVQNGGPGPPGPPLSYGPDLHSCNVMNILLYGHDKLSFYRSIDMYTSGTKCRTTL